MKRIVPFILLFVALLLPSTVFARKVVVPIDEIVFHELGVTTSERLPSGKYKMTTVGLEGEGKFNCNGDPDCIATGLDWQELNIRQDIQMITDPGPGTLNSAYLQARGEVEIHLPSGGTRTLIFRGKTKGKMAVIETMPNGDKTLEGNFRLPARITGSSVWRGTLFIMDLKLVVSTFFADDDKARIDALTGSGTFSFFVDQVDPAE
jgi:hypothetical protein